GRNGAISPGGGCHLLQTADGRIAVNLVRDDDWALLPAWLEQEACAVGDWTGLAQQLRTRTMHDLVERGRLLGLAIAPSVPTPTRPVPWFTNIVSTPPGSAPYHTHPRVVDMSSLWAGPLCSHLLLRLGADVVKVESPQRPDGARRGPAAFFDLLHAGKRCVALDPATTQGREQLLALIASADIVIEGSRPRALRQLGLAPEQLVAEFPQLTWISLTGYGRGGEQEQWAAFGDDAAVNAGLSYLLRQTTGLDIFGGDAIADPLTGLHAALAAWAGFQRGGAGLVAIALCDVVRHCLQFERPASAEAACERNRDWTAHADHMGAQAAMPSPRRPTAAASALGADTAAVFADWKIKC
ncbi:MAG: CoA transferase, partial [Stenotrophobium sp.]